MSNDAMIIDDNNVVDVVLSDDGSIVGTSDHDVVPVNDGSIVGTSDHDVVPVNTRATTRVAPTLGHVIGTYKSLVTIQPINYSTRLFSTLDHAFNSTNSTNPTNSTNSL
jgi:hypothetical protein